MKYIEGVYATDDVSRYNTRFTQSALASTLWKIAGVGVPMHINHDLTRPVGWNLLRAVYFEPNWTRVSGVALHPETDQEKVDLQDRVIAYRVAAIAEQSENVQALENLLGNSLSDQGKLILNECLAYIEPGLATRAFPDIFQRQHADRDELIPLDELTPLGPGVFQCGDLALFAHSYFRRLMFPINSLNSPFFEYVQDLLEQGFHFKIALDPDMVGLVSTYHQKLEYVYWRGPLFNEDVASIRTGVTQYGADDDDKFLYKIARTELWWHSRQGTHTLEAEELADSEVDAKCRYVHTRVDESTGQIVHFDGAVRAYTGEQYASRLAVDIMHFGRNSEYTKLWRTDDGLSVLQWKRLLSDYFRDNVLIGEYLGAPKDEYERPEYVTHNIGLSTLEQEYVPYTMRAEQGIRLALSFHEQRPSGNAFQIVPLDFVAFEYGEFTTVEAETIELAKIFKRFGCLLELPEGVKVVHFEDHYANLPLIVLSGDEPFSNIQTVIHVWKELIRAWLDTGHDKVVVCNIGFPVEDKEARISIMGHIADLALWFSSDVAHPPTSKEKLFAWADEVAEFLTTNFNEARNQPFICDVLKNTTGVLYIDRKEITDPNLQMEVTDRGLFYKFPTAKNPPLAEAIQEGRIVPALGMINPVSTCSRCSADYYSCDCSKTMDNDVVQQFTSMESLFQFWTDRPAMIPLLG